MSFVKYEQKDQVAVLTIDRPEALNALNTQVLCDLDEAIAKVEQADDVRVVILTGAEPSRFLTGLPLRQDTAHAPVPRPLGVQLSLFE